MASKKGEKYSCDVCGLVVSVEEECECDECVIVCCEKPMKKTK
jgi:hypothetical protein